MNLIDHLHRQANAQPQATALIDATGSLTFAGLETAASRAAALLHQHGLRAGDAVLVFHPMSAELYIALAAIFRLGLVALFIDPSQGRSHIERCCALLPPKALLASPKAHLLRLVSPALRRIPLKFATGWGAPGAIRWRRWAETPPHPAIFEATDDTPALITFTSGSTGQPKAAVRTHGFLLRQHRVLEATLGLTSADTVLTTLPIFVLSHLASGVYTLIPNVDIRHPGRVDAEPVVAQINRQGVTCIEASPAFLERIVQQCAKTGQTLPTLRRIFTGGAPVFPKLLQQVERVAPNATITAVYGSTEAEPVAHIDWHEVSTEDKARMATGGGLLAGCPVDAIQVCILPDRWGAPIGPFDRATFAHVALPPGKTGEIVVAGPHVLSGYLYGQGDAESKFRVDNISWHRTGDAGYFDEKGRLWLMGRCAARIEDERGVLYPFAVEAVVQQEPGVKHCAFLAHQGQRVLAVEMNDLAPTTDLSSLQERLAWAQLDLIRVLRRMPLDRRHNAKIDYTALRRLLDQRGGNRKASKDAGASSVATHRK